MDGFIRSCVIMAVLMLPPDNNVLNAIIWSICQPPWLAIPFVLHISNP